MKLLEKIEVIAKLGSYQTDLTTGTWTGSANFIKIFGLPKKEAYTVEEFQGIVHPEDFQDVMTYFGECLAQQKDFNYEYRCIKSDGSLIYVNSRSQVYYDKDGTPLKILGVKQDITERYLREQKLSEINDNLKTLNDKKNSVIGQVAHDLRNPLHAIESLSFLLKDNLTSEQLELVKLQEQALENTKDIISELLEVAALENTAQKLTTTPTDLNLLIFKSIQQLQAKAYKKGINMITNLAKNAILPLNPQKFLRVLDNLLSNAIKFSLEHKEIYIETNIEENHIILTIMDEGIGIPQKAIPFLFKDLPSDLKRQGTNGESSNGIGLSIVKEIIDLHEATIEVESQKSQGTKFEIALKRA